MVWSALWKCFFGSIGRRLEECYHCQKLNPHSQDAFRSGQCQADSPTVRNVSQWAKTSLSLLPMDAKEHVCVSSCRRPRRSARRSTPPPRAALGAPAAPSRASRRNPRAGTSTTWATTRARPAQLSRNPSRVSVCAARSLNPGPGIVVWLAYPGSHHRCHQRTFKRAACVPRREERGACSPPASRPVSTPGHSIAAAGAL